MSIEKAERLIPPYQSVISTTGLNNYSMAIEGDKIPNQLSRAIHKVGERGHEVWSLGGQSVNIL